MVKDGKLRLQVLISELGHRATPPPAASPKTSTRFVVHLGYTLRHQERWRSTNLIERSLGELRRRKGHGTVPRRDQLPLTRLGGARPVFSHASNGATFTDVDRQHLYRIKYRQANRETLDAEVTAA